MNPATIAVIGGLLLVIVVLIVYLKKHQSATLDYMQAAAIDIKSHVGNVVSSAQTKIQNVAVAAVARVAPTPQPTLGEKTTDPVLTPAAAIPTAASAPPPMSPPGGGSPLPDEKAIVKGIAMDDPRLTTPTSIFFGLKPLEGQAEVDFLVAQAMNDWQGQQAQLGGKRQIYQQAYAAGGPFYKPKEHTGHLIYGSNTIVGVGGITRDQFVTLSADQKAKIEAYTGFPVA